MKKKEYISPKVVVGVVDYMTMLLAGSEQYRQQTGLTVTAGANSDGTGSSETIGVSATQKGGVTDIGYSKQHSAMESWDSWD